MNLMRNITDNRLFNMILLFTIIGEFCLPFALVYKTPQQVEDEAVQAA